MKQMTKLENIVMNRTSCNRMIANLVANDILQEVEKGIEVEVAREIFEDIERVILHRMIFDTTLIDDRVIFDIAELKKKYTESEDKV